MGKRKGGGEEAAQPTTTQVISLLQRELANEKREPAEIRVQRVTAGLFSVTVQAHGEPEAETYFLRIGD